jgi:hypothetical protein
MTEKTSNGVSLFNILSLYICGCESERYLDLLLPWHWCQAIYSRSRSHINTAIKVTNAPSTNEWKSLLLLLVQDTVRIRIMPITFQATKKKKY